MPKKPSGGVGRDGGGGREKRGGSGGPYVCVVKRHTSLPALQGVLELLCKGIPLDSLLRDADRKKTSRGGGGVHLYCYPSCRDYMYYVHTCTD